MKNRNLYLLSATLFLSTLLFTSCNDLVQQTDQDFLTTGTWIVKSVVNEPLIIEEVKPILGYETDCKHDDLLNMNLDGSYYISDNLIVCNDTNIPLKGGSWQTTIENGQKSIVFTTESKEELFILESVSKYTLILKQEWTKTGETEITTYANTLFEN